MHTATKTLVLVGLMMARNMTAKFAALWTDLLENYLRELQSRSFDLVSGCGDLLMTNYAYTYFGLQIRLATVLFTASKDFCGSGD